ncbi:hypothetical protein Cgig2_011336 [Carnegiea gigantea]|uniref:Uncharacterized protein n=1 Tax=Carnegiea gigantea TaxID=171969 RepID=A0A9Q1Q6L3_9CARY|nr:hypothetical protein Cgig2_011336 [Carnegiea gigantea]
MSPKALRQVIENLNNKRNEAIKGIGFRDFLYLQADMIPGKLALWLVRHFNTCSSSLPLTHGRIRVTEHDVHMMLGLRNGPLKVVEPKSESKWPKRDSIHKCMEVIEMMQGQVNGGEDFRRNLVMLVVSTCLHGRQRGEVNYLIMNALVGARQFATLRGLTNDEIKSRVGQEFVIGFGRGYLENTLDKMTIIDKQEEVNEEELHGKNDEDEAKAKDETGVLELKAPFHDGKVATNLIISNSRLPVEVIIKLEEFIHGARAPLKRVRKVAVQLTSDALIGDMTNKLKSRSWVVSQDSYESEGVLMEIDAIEKHFMGSQDTVHDFLKFTPPSFTPGEKEALPKGVVIADSEPNILTEKVQVDILIRCMKSSAQYSSTPLPPGTSSHSLMANFLLLFDESPIIVCSQEDNYAFVDRSMIRIVKPDLEI